jgi:uncharacterized protein YbjT (DUF2867 family)
MSERILVTGASGTVGRELTQQLQRLGANFAVMSSSRSSRIPADVAVVHGDFTQTDSLTQAFQGIHTLFLLFPLHPGMVDMARKAVAAARAAGVKHIVRSSGAGADSGSPASIARVQGEIDDIVVASGLPYTLLRPAFFMQNLVNFSGQSIRTQGAFYAPNGDGAISAIDARDIAEAAANVLLNPKPHAGKRYTLTGPQALSNTQMAQAISQAVGKPVRYVDVPEQAAVDAMSQLGMPEPVIDWLMSLNHVIKQGWAAGVSTDLSQLLGREPRRFDAFAREHASAWR